MAMSKRGGTGRSNGARRAATNNADGRNQHTGIMGTARARPVATAAAVGGAVAAGVFLWSRRNQIAEQAGNLTDQFRGKAEDSGDGRSQLEIAEEALTLKQIGEAS